MTLNLINIQKNWSTLKLKNSFVTFVSWNVTEIFKQCVNTQGEGLIKTTECESLMWTICIFYIIFAIHFISWMLIYRSIDKHILNMMYGVIKNAIATIKQKIYNFAV